ncbi:hypothetical protein SELMODRAFT_129774 [Selaginella moellendorffii]|uniref:Uncharacterized protein n=1 Tax=Selaginella moellendorffii TaxID=88036 RepID=D8T1G3_SELML|nr:hypothetical protein SELMODRAFT_129774 [Selaginella moellendorffii]
MSFSQRDFLLSSRRVRLLDAGSKRVIIDTDFSSQFVIARPSDEYQAILAEIPPVFVGTKDELHKFLHLISLAMKRSLKASHAPSLAETRLPHREVVLAIPENNQSNRQCSVRHAA